MTSFDNIEIRAFEPEDFRELTDILNMKDVISGTLQQAYRSYAERSRLMEYFSPQLNIVAVIDGAVVGHACLNLDSDISCRHVGRIDIVVHENFRRQGVGRALLSTIINQSDNEIGLHRVELTVLSNNIAAIGLYEELGFVQEGIFRDYAFKGGKFINAIPMARIRPSVM